MKTLGISLLLLLIVSSFTCKAQEKYEFKEPKIENGVKQIRFLVNGISTDDERKNVQNVLNAHPDIFYFVVYPNMECFAKVNPDITVDKMNILLEEINASIDNNSLVKTKISQEKNEAQAPVEKRIARPGLPPSFPKKIDTGNPYEDEQKYAAEIKIWKEQHPAEWQQMLENRNK